MTYLIVKSLHIIFVVAWMAGLLIYFRYKLHQMSSIEGEGLFDAMRSASLRLRRVILTPSLVAVWLFGLLMLALNPQLLTEGWMIAKLLLVLGLSGIHGWMIGVGRSIDQGKPKLSATRMKFFNELPFIIMVVVVFLAVLKPF